MSCEAEDVIYSGEDAKITIDLKGTLYADCINVIVGITIQGVLKKTFVKLSPTEGNEVNEDTEYTDRCFVLLTHEETKTWSPGLLGIEITLVETDSDFPEGKHVSFKYDLVEFQNVLTANYDTV